jgi:hypothetical protein
MSLCSSLNVKDKFHTHTKQQEITVLYSISDDKMKEHIKKIIKQTDHKTENQNTFICLWGWIQNSTKCTRLKRRKQKESPTPHYCYRYILNHYIHLLLGALNHTFVLPMVSPPCHPSTDSVMQSSQ